MKDSLPRIELAHKKVHLLGNVQLFEQIVVICENLDLARIIFISVDPVHICSVRILSIII